MEAYISKFMTYITSDAGTNIFLLMVAIIFTVCLFVFFQVTKDEKYEKDAFKRTYKAKKKVNYITDVLLRQLKENLTTLVTERGKPQSYISKLMNLFVGMVVVLSIFMIMVKQPIFAIILPVLLLYVMTKVTGLIKKSFADYVTAQLPSAIDGIIRVFSGYGDLKTVLYESGQTLPQPMKGIFEDLSRRMQTEPPELVLQEFMDNSKDIWIYCLSFNLLSYVEDASKKDVIENLRELKEIIDRDNKEKKKQKIERKLTTSINYLLCILAFGGFIANIIFNRAITISFFFSTVGGIASFLVGISLLVISIFSNLLIGSGKD